MARKSNVATNSENCGVASAIKMAKLTVKCAMFPQRAFFEFNFKKTSISKIFFAHFLKTINKKFFFSVFSFL